MVDNAGGGSNDNDALVPYEVGYGKPPRHTRFRPGQSGNPSGRRRQPRSLVRDLVDVLHEPVFSGEDGAGEDGAGETVTRQYSILRALATKAMEGDRTAIAQVIRLSQWMSGFRPGYWFEAPEDWDGEGEAGENSLPPGNIRE